MKKSNSQDVDLLYILEDEKDKKKKKKKNTKSKKNNESKKKNNNETKSGVFDFDDEIVIGITKKEDTDESKKGNNKKSKKNDNSKKQKSKTRKINNEKSPKKHTFIKFIILFIIIVGAVVCFLMSPIFNVKNIVVTGNSKLTTDEIISLSGIETDKNAFRMSMGVAEKRIKENPYVASVNVSRKLPSEISIEVTERVATYILEFVNGYVLINNQGYMLEISETKGELPIISGVNTPVEEYKAGNRLGKEDLQKLETVLKIMESLNSYGLAEFVTGFNIADKGNYILYMDGEGKIVYLGNASNINTRIMYLKEIVEREKGINSEVFINKDLNKNDVYTRERV